MCITFFYGEQNKQTYICQLLFSSTLCLRLSLLVFAIYAPLHFSCRTSIHVPTTKNQPVHQHGTVGVLTPDILRSRLHLSLACQDASVHRKNPSHLHTHEYSKSHAIIEGCQHEEIEVVRRLPRNIPWLWLPLFISPSSLGQVIHSPLFSQLFYKKLVLVFAVLTDSI